MKLTTARPTGGSESEQVIRLPYGMYGAMFANYSKPIQRQKYQSNEMETRIILCFLVTHGANEQPLPQFGEAVRGCPLKLYYNAEQKKKSNLFEFYEAILNSGKKAMTPEQIINASDDELPDLDELIGFPVSIILEPGSKPNAKGLIRDNVKSIMAPSAGMRKAIVDIYKTAQFETTKDGLRAMKFPSPSYESDDSASGHAVEEGANDAMPF